MLKKEQEKTLARVQSWNGKTMHRGRDCDGERKGRLFKSKELGDEAIKGRERRTLPTVKGWNMEAK